jgi:hypothetical protein
MITRLQTYPARLLALAFDDEEEFQHWAELLSPYDAKYWLDEFEKEELYEFCAILRDVINKKQNIIVYLYNGLPD